MIPNVVMSLAARPAPTASCVRRYRVNCRNSASTATAIAAGSTRTTSTIATSSTLTAAMRRRRTGAIVLRATSSGDDDDISEDRAVDARGEGDVGADAPVEGHELDGANPLDNPLFNDDFKKAFIAAQERLEEQQAPMKAQIDAEVAEIMAQVNAERAAAAEAKQAGEDPEDDFDDDHKDDGAAAKERTGTGTETPAGASDAKKKKNDAKGEVDAAAARQGGGGPGGGREEVINLKEEYAAALDNPLFNDGFKKAFLEAQERLEKKQAPMWAQIDTEVEEIMKRVNEERAAAAEGREPPSPPPPTTTTTTRAAPAFRVPNYAPVPLSAVVEPAADPLLDLGIDFVELGVDVLAQMKHTSEANLQNLINTLAGVENAIKAEQMQLERINFAVRKAARYAEAESIVKERKKNTDNNADA